MATIINFTNSVNGNTLIIDKENKTLIDSGGKISKRSSWRNRNFSSFYIRQGLANASSYSFESKALPNYYLKVRGTDEICLERKENSVEYKNSTTFTHSDIGLASMSNPTSYICSSTDNTVVQAALDTESNANGFSAVTFSQAEVRWKDSYTISFNYFGDKSVHLTFDDDKVGFRSYSFWQDFDKQSNTAGWFLDYVDNNSPYFTIQNVSDDKQRYLALSDDNETVELVGSARDNARMLDKVLWRADILSARGQYIITNKKLEAHSLNGLCIQTDYVDSADNIEKSVAVMKYDELSNTEVILNIDERFIPTQLTPDDVKVANSLLRQSNGLTSQGMVIPLTPMGGPTSWSVRRFKTSIVQDKTLQFTSHIGVDPEVSPEASEWLELKESILRLPVMEGFTEQEQTIIFDLARSHLSKAYRSHVLGKSASGFTEGIIWLTPDLENTNILEQVESYIDYQGESFRAISSIEGLDGFTAAFGFVMKRDDRGDISYFLGDPTAGETKPPDN